MKTTIDIPDGVLQEAMAHTHSTTKRDAVVTALEDFNRRARLRVLAEQLGKSDTFMTLDDLTQMRATDIPQVETKPAGK